jgi:hypothetical protein
LVGLSVRVFPHEIKAAMNALYSPVGESFGLHSLSIVG